MSYEKTPAGHLVAFVAILIWGIAFISTKVFLRSFSPVETLLIRFVIGYLALWMACSGNLILDSRRQEYFFAAAGLCGITMYYFLENIALTFTPTSNTGVIISIAPFFTVILNCLSLGRFRPGKRFFISFLLAMVGICLVSLGSSATLSINPVGGVLAVTAAVVWAVYSILIKEISTPGYGMIQTTRRTLFYRTLFTVPITLIMGSHVAPDRIIDPLNLCDLLFLGPDISVLCFVT